MPTKKFPLDADGPNRLTIQWKGIWKNIQVSCDDQLLGVIENQKALKAGADFSLPDGRTLHVELTSGLQAHLQLLIDGTPVPGAGNDPAAQIKAAVGVLYFIAGLSILVGVVALAGVAFLADMGFGVSSIIAGLIVGGLGYAVQSSHSRVALVVAMVLIAADGVATVWVVTEAGGQPPTVAIVMRVFFLMYLFTGLKAIGKIGPNA